MVKPLNKTFCYFLIYGIVSLWLTACAVPAPVQEMSNARQSLQAAQEARAQVYAPGKFSKARQLLDYAARELENGDYIQAKGFALEAKMEATQARQAAINLQKK